MDKEIITATINALRSVSQERLFRTERGYQGHFYCALQNHFDRIGLLAGELLLEMEYQKSARHGTYQRPDIVLHVPAEVSGDPPHVNNVAVWALKLRASEVQVRKDFEKLDDMFRTLEYSIGIFINIDSRLDGLSTYSGTYRQRLHTFAVVLESGRVVVSAGISDDLRGA